jgi:SAM-dependent methyltransferase
MHRPGTELGAHRSGSIRRVAHEEAFDGSPEELYLELVDMGESDLVHAVVPNGAAILELGCGTGRMTRRLIDLGHHVTAVDQSEAMLRHVPDQADRVLADIESLELPGTFPVVLMASNLINTPDPSKRRALLRACRRHVTDDGVVVIQRYDPLLRGLESPDWVQRGPIAVSVHQLLREGDEFSASVEYRRGDRRWKHHFSAVVLDDNELTVELSHADLGWAGTLDPMGSWLLAKPSDRLDRAPR